MEEDLKRSYLFGPFRLDARERLLLRDGDVVPLTPKAFDLLLTLVEQPGHLLQKETLLKAVWPDAFVEENNLTDNVSRLRKVLGEGENGQKFIETVPKRGYRFVAEVRTQTGERSAVSAGMLEIRPPATRTGLAFRHDKGLKILLSSLAFLSLAVIGSGIWLHSKLGKRAEIEQLEFKGNFYLSRWNEDEIRKGIEFYNRAIAMDPTSASPYEGLAIAWIFLSDLHVSPREAMPKAKAAIVSSLQRNERSAHAHVCLGVIKTQYEWDWLGAEQEFKRAIALDPEYSSAHQLYGWFLIAMGRFVEAQAEMKRSLEGDSLSGFALWGLGDAFYFARQYEQAVEQYRRSIGAEPKVHWSHLMLGCAYEQQEKFAEAISEFEQARRVNDNPQVLAALGHVFAVSGQAGKAQKIVEELGETERRYVSPYDVATICAGLGEKEQALAWLEKAYEERSGWLAFWLKVDPRFDGLRREEPFRALMKRIGHTL